MDKPIINFSNYKEFADNYIPAIMGLAVDHKFDTANIKLLADDVSRVKAEVESRAPEYKFTDLMVAVIKPAEIGFQADVSFSFDTNQEVKFTDPANKRLTISISQGEKREFHFMEGFSEKLVEYKGTNADANLILALDNFLYKPEF